MGVSVHSNAWALLLRSERKEAGVVAVSIMLNSVASVLGVSSVLPFLTVLSDPNMISEVDSLAWAYDQFEFGSKYGFLVYLGLLSLTLILVSNAVQIVNGYVNVRFTTLLQQRFSTSLFAHYLRQPLEFFIGRHSGEMESNIFNECREVVANYYKPLVTLATSSLVVLGMLALAVWVNPRVGFASIVLIGGVYAAIHYYTKRYIQQVGDKRIIASSDRHKVAGEAIEGIKHIKIEGAEEHFFEEFRKPSMELAGYQVRVELISQLPRFLVHSSIFGGVVLLCILSIDANSLESGQALGGVLPMLGVFALAGLRILPEVQKIHASLTKIAYGGPALDRLHAELVGKHTNSSLFNEPMERLRLRRQLVLDCVSYTYPNSTSSGLTEVSLSLRAGMCLGVVGNTGSGKTTLSKILLGLLTPLNGRVLADDVSITKSNQRAWWSSVGYVPQDVFLLDASVVENIAFGIPPSKIDYRRVHDACTAAQLRPFIENELPDSYATRVGERGVRLSVGQRQRIGIARALYHDTDFIVFDEATSSLDNLTELEVMDAIDELLGKKTIVLVAHRLSTIKRCDSIAVMSEGRIVDLGTWDFLMENCESFRRIAELANVA